MANCINLWQFSFYNFKVTDPQHSTLYFLLVNLPPFRCLFVSWVAKMNQMKRQLTLFLLLLLPGIFQISKAQQIESKFGWRLAAQAYSFNRFTFFEAVDKTDSCGLQYIEAFRGQTIGGGIDGKIDYHMDEATRSKILGKLKEKGVKLKSYGVINGTSPDDWRKLFEFAKSMGIETIVSEPKEEEIPMLSQLCDEFRINLAIHNHPDPSHYWNPNVLLAAISGQSKRIGACADIGHWIRSGLDPIVCLKKLKGKIIEFHFKDLNEKSKKAHDVIWGTGISNIEAVLKELKKQKFKGTFCAEYEYHWFNNVPEITASVKNFREMVER